MDALVFSPESQLVAYGARANGKWLVIVNGNEGRSYDDIITIDGGIVFDASDRLHYLAILGNQVYLVEEHVQ